MSKLLTLTVSRDQNKIVRRLLEREASAYKNWIVSAVESGDMERAQKLTKELRAIQDMFHIVIPDDMIERYTQA